MLLYNLGCNGVGFLPSIAGGHRIARLLSGERLPREFFRSDLSGAVHGGSPNKHPRRPARRGPCPPCRAARPSSLQRDFVGNKPLPTAAGEAGAEPRHVGHPPLVEDDGFAVQNEILNGKRGDGAGDGGESVGPVEAVAGEDAGGAAADVRLDAVAVELNLV